MNRLYGYVAGALALGLLAGTASAQPAPAPAPAAADCCADNCCDSGHWLADLELTFLRFHRTEEFDSSDVFGFEASPRLTIGYVGASGLGARLRWWTYDHANTDSEGDLISIDTTNLDLELFEVIKLGECTRLEWSAGFRYNDFELFDEDGPDLWKFDGPGIVIGAKITRQLFAHSAIYASIRHAWIMGDIFANEDDTIFTDFDTTHSQFEGTVGLEHTRCLSNGSVLTLRAGVEMQHWSGYDDTDTEDVGFGGFVLGAGLSY